MPTVKNVRQTVCLFCLSVLMSSLFAQTEVAISGTVKSSQGPLLEGATISFYSSEDQSLGNNCTTDREGRFKSEKIFKIGQTVVLKISKPGFAAKSLRHITENLNGISKTDDINLDPKTVITGFVIDSVSTETIQGAVVSFYDKDNKLIQSRSTNSEGYFNFETDFTYGEIIRIRVSNLNYFPREQTLRIVKPEREDNRMSFRIPKISDSGMKVVIRVTDSKKNKALPGVKLSYFDGRAYRDTIVSASGETQLKNIFQQPGTRLDLRLRKPGYREISAKPTLAVDLNYFEYRMEKERAFPVCKCLLGGGISLGVFSGAMFLASKSAYKAYKPFTNPQRDQDYDKANLRLRISAVSGGAAILALAGWQLCKHRERKKEKASGTTQPIGYIDASGNTQFGVVYYFNH